MKTKGIESLWKYRNPLFLWFPVVGYYGGNISCPSPFGYGSYSGPRAHISTAVGFGNSYPNADPITSIESGLKMDVCPLLCPR